jgi:hypothetical protein
MPSSTSSSDFPQTRARAGALVLLGVAIALGAGLELAARYVVPAVSKVEGDVLRDYRTALAASEPGRRTILLVGNSLLGSGVDPVALQRRMGDDVRLKRFVVNSTVYYDWYYGARRIFADGARCDYLVVMLSPSHLASNSVYGDYFANHLMRPGDLLDVASAVHATRDRTASMALGAFSDFWADRAHLRNWVLQTTIPKMERLAELLAAGPPPATDPDTLYRTALDRLARLRSVADANRATLILVIPPALRGEDLVAAVEAAGRRAGVTVLVPIRPGALAPEYFSDGFHLTEAGRVLFTERLAIALGNPTASSAAGKSGINERAGR